MIFGFGYSELVNAASYTYDNLGRLISVNRANGSYSTYTCDAGGNILTVTNVTSPDSLTVVFTDPQDQATNITTDQTIHIQFNQNIEQGYNFVNINLLEGLNSVPITSTTSGDTLIIDPDNNLTGSTSYTLFVPAGAVKKLSGTETNNEVTLQFTTAP